MKAPKPLQPSSGELELLKILWELGPATVNQIHDKVNERSRPPKSLTTTLKVIQVMEQKGFVIREGKTRPYHFRAVPSKGETQQTLIKDLLARVFQGNAKSLVLCTLETAEISQEELRDIRALLNARKKGGQGA